LAGCCECGDEPSGSGATQLSVGRILWNAIILSPSNGFAVLPFAVLADSVKYVVLSHPLPPPGLVLGNLIAFSSVFFHFNPFSTNTYRLCVRDLTKSRLAKTDRFVVSVIIMSSVLSLVWLFVV
jgi:hypothetical protein